MVFDLRDTLSGVIGSVCCVYVGLPFDVVKLRLQTQHQQQQQQQQQSNNGSSRRGAPRHAKSSLLRLARSASPSSSGFYRGPFDCLFRMVSTEGIRSLWKGAIPALSSGISENAALFTANDALKRLFISINRARFVPDDDDGEFPVEVPLPPPPPAATSNTSTSNTADHTTSATTSTSSEIFHRIHQTTTHPPTFPFPMDEEDDADDEDLDAIIAEYESETALSIGEYYLCGGIAGIFSSTVMCPSEVVKVRLQYQRNTIAAVAAMSSPLNGAAATQQPSNIYRGPIDCAVKTVRNEGWRALYKGYTALLMRDVPFNTIFIGSYDTICYGLCKWYNTPKDDLPPSSLFLAGGLSGMIGWSIVFPLDVIKSRMHLLESATATPSAFRVASNIVRAEGLRTLYAGWSAAVMRAFPANAALFLSVELCRRVFSTMDGEYRQQM